MRVVLAVIAGYATMFIGVFAMFSLAYALLKADGAFKPGTYELSTTWLVLSIVLGSVAAVVGGMVAARIAPLTKAPAILAGIVLVLGVLMGIMTINSNEWKATPPPRIGEVTNSEAMNNAKQPALNLFLNPVLGAVGIMVGAGLLARKRT